MTSPEFTEIFKVIFGRYCRNDFWVISTRNLPTFNAFVVNFTHFALPDQIRTWETV